MMMTRARRPLMWLLMLMLIGAACSVLFISVIDVQLVVDAVTTTTSVSASTSTSASSNNRSSLSSSLLSSTSSSLSSSSLPLRRQKLPFPQKHQQQQRMNKYRNQRQNRKLSSSSLDLVLHRISRGGGNKILDNKYIISFGRWIGSEIRSISSIAKKVLLGYAFMLVGIIWFQIFMSTTETEITEFEFTIGNLLALCILGGFIIALDLSLTLVEKLIVSRRHRHQQQKQKQQRSDRDSVLNIIHTSKAVLSALYFVMNIVKRRRRKTQRRTSYSDANE